MAAAVGIGMAVGSSYLSGKSERKAQAAIAKAQAESNEISKRRAAIENQRARRQAAASTVSGQAQNIALGYQQGAEGSSMIAGSNVGLQTDMSSAIGASNVALSANLAQAQAAQRGADLALKHQNNAAIWKSVSGLSGTVAGLAWPS